MKLASFCVLLVFALIFAGLNIIETLMYQAWDDALEQQKVVHIKLSFFQQQNETTQNLLKRIAIESQHDPALAQLLKERNIKVVIKGQPNPVTPAAAPTHP